jgi:hypothetical protein
VLTSTRIRHSLLSWLSVTVLAACNSSTDHAAGSPDGGGSGEDDASMSSDAGSQSRDDSGQEAVQDSGQSQADAGSVACDLTPKKSGAQPDSYMKFFDMASTTNPYRSRTFDSVESKWRSLTRTPCAWYEVIANSGNDYMAIDFPRKPTLGKQTWPVYSGEYNGYKGAVSVKLNNGYSVKDMGTVTTETTSAGILIHGEGVGLVFDSYSFKGDTLYFEVIAQ